MTFFFNCTDESVDETLSKWELWECLCLSSWLKRTVWGCLCPYYVHYCVHITLLNQLGLWIQRGHSRERVCTDSPWSAVVASSQQGNVVIKCCKIKAAQTSIPAIKESCQEVEMRSVVQGVFLVLLSVSTTRLRKRGIDVLLKWQLTVYCVWEIVPGRLPSIYLSRCGFILFFRTKRTLMGSSHGASVFWWIAMGNLTFVYNLKCGLLLHKDFPFSAQPPALLTKTPTNLIVLLFCTIETAREKKLFAGGFFLHIFSRSLASSVSLGCLNSGPLHVESISIRKSRATLSTCWMAKSKLALVL